MLPTDTRHGLIHTYTQTFSCLWKYPNIRCTLMSKHLKATEERLLPYTPQSCSRQPLLPCAVVQLVTMTSNVTIDVTLTFLPFPE